jgi:hypothetical protein
LVNGRRALAMRCTEAVGAGIAAADDHHAFAGSSDRRLLEVAFLHAVGPRQVFHRLVDAGELAPGYRQVASGRRAAGQYDRVVTRAQLVDSEIHTHVHTRTELGALGAHLLEPAIEESFLHLEFRDAIPE